MLLQPIPPVAGTRAVRGLTAERLLAAVGHHTAASYRPLAATATATATAPVHTISSRVTGIGTSRRDSTQVTVATAWAANDQRHPQPSPSSTVAGELQDLSERADPESNPDPDQSSSN